MATWEYMEESWDYVKGIGKKKPHPKAPQYKLTVNTTSTEKEEKMAEKTLYEINRGDIVSYGYKLAVNSAGQWVMELKGSGEVIAVDKSTVTEVVPYTVDIVYQEGGTVYSYFNEKRDLQIGDFFINSPAFGGPYQIGRVVGVDTKQKKATVEIKYLRKL